MSSSQPTPNQDACAVKTRLISKLQAIHQRIFDLDDQEVQAIFRGDYGALTRLDAELADARTARQTAMEAIREHVKEHGC